MKTAAARKAPLHWLVLGATALTGMVVLFFFDPNRGGVYPLCLFHKTTGLLCPGCGGLRAAHQLLHGHFAAAFHFNPLLVILAPAAAGWLVWAKARQWRGERESLLKPWMLWLLLAIVLLFFILRNLPFAASYGAEI
jgi:hypothetical protein